MILIIFDTFDSVGYNHIQKTILQKCRGVSPLNITMLTIGSVGDVRPYILLGSELKKRGHNITLAAFSGFESMAADASLSFYPLSGDAESFIASIMNPDTNALTYLPRICKNLKSVVPDLLCDLEESCHNADAIICNFFGSVYYSVAEKKGIPCIQTHFFPMDLNGTVPISSVRNQHLGKALNKATYKIGYYAIGTVESWLLSNWRKSSNLSVRKAATHPDYHLGSHLIPVIYAISPNVFPRPPEWGPNIYMTGFWFDDSPSVYQPPESLLRFLDEGDIPVYIGFGSMNTGNMNKLISMLLRALHAANLRAVICSPWASKKLKSGKRVYFTEYVSHDWLFPRVRAVIHHGGAGTTSAGLRWGCPTWVIPFAGDQPFWGSRIHSIGCGPRPVSRENLTVRKLTAGLIDLISQKEYKKKATALSSLLAQENGTENAASLIERLIRNW